MAGLVGWLGLWPSMIPTAASVAGGRWIANFALCLPPYASARIDQYFFARKLKCNALTTGAVACFRPLGGHSEPMPDETACFFCSQPPFMTYIIDGLSADSHTHFTSDPRFSQAPWNDSRWIALEGAVQEFVTALGETPQVEWIGLVSYASNYNRFGVNNLEAEINQTLTENHARVNQEMAVISGTVFNGLTNIAAGIDEGVVALFAEGSSRPFAAKTMVLMTDGIPNPSNPAQVRARATVAANRNVKIYTVTFGDAADQGLMRDVADIGSGEHYHADNESQLDEIFRQIALTIPLTFTD